MAIWLSASGRRRQLRDRLIDVRFGPTTAAKAMYAVRPNAFLPWDDAIRKKLGYREDAASYTQALRARAPRRLLAWASRSRLAPFIKLARTIRRHHAGIFNAIRLGLSSGRLDGLNSRIRHRSFGFPLRRSLTTRSTPNQRGSVSQASFARNSASWSGARHPLADAAGALAR